jgi:hypothetical protein
MNRTHEQRAYHLGRCRLSSAAKLASSNKNGRTRLSGSAMRSPRRSAGGIASTALTTAVSGPSMTISVSVPSRPDTRRLSVADSFHGISSMYASLARGRATI